MSVHHGKKKLSAVWTLVLAAALSSGCSVGANEAKPAAEAAQTVEVMTVALEPIPDRYTLAGTMQALEESVVSFQADGQIMKTFVKEGDVVKTGDALASLDPSNYEYQVQRAEASLGQADAAVSQAEASVEAAVAGVASAQESQDVLGKNAVTLTQEAYRKATYDLNKAELMYDDGDLSSSDLNNVRLAFKQAETNYLNAEAQLKQSSSGLRSAEATLAQARAGLKQAQAAQREALAGREQAKLALEKTSLASPIDGVVLEKYVSAGQLTGGGQSAYRIGNISQLKVVLPVPDQNIREWSIGQEVALTLYNESRTGTVRNINPTTNAGSGSVNVEVLVPNPNADWLPGQVVKAARTSSGKKGIFVPVAAVVSAGSEPYVFKYVNGKAVKTPVTLGELANNQLHLTSGLEPGDQVVTKGAAKLFDGDAIATSKERAE
ncbi:RND family efflux transporter, MFP subunit [Paenibacillus sp. UNCCL117]|uniref:efflux RND transporter periplasmic adaptor subunit n=1 Tax=unclassified Paenibacillus TaxID=185978 RepID=UPI000891FB55|nr:MULTISPECIES: efflux RND transporter periplasmic adaptor subunit [unclassified Paenibacillus]SDC95334.1 RND family efflux transporter, MFP subunit [Paenibacillus sp. cl123]SFW30009.1 RND family efflux transporter, MFP subunit [Paenibacillus sp. UNCCL117]